MGCAQGREFKRSCAALSITTSHLDAGSNGTGVRDGDEQHDTHHHDEYDGDRRNHHDDSETAVLLMERDALKPERMLKDLSQVSLGELLKLITKIRKRMHGTRTAGAPVKYVRLKLAAEVAEMARPVADLSVDIKHLDDMAAVLREWDAPDGAVSAVVIEMPVLTKGVLHMGKLAGNVMIIANQLAFKQQFPHYLGVKKQSVKTDTNTNININSGDGGASNSSGTVLRLAAFFNEPITTMAQFDLIKHISVMLSIGASQEYTGDIRVVSDHRDDIVVCVPPLDMMTVRCQVNTTMEKSLVSSTHAVLNKAGFVARYDTDVDQGDDVTSLMGLITLLSLLNNVDTTVHFDSIHEFLALSPSVNAWTAFAMEWCRYPSFRLREAMCDLLGDDPVPLDNDGATSPVPAPANDAELIATFRKLYPQILSNCRNAFQSVEGIYHVRVLSQSVMASMSVRGVDMFKAFPDLDYIDDMIRTRREVAERQRLEAAKLGGIERFTAAEFDDMRRKADAPVAEPFIQVYPTDEDTGGGSGVRSNDWVKVWIDETESDGVAVLRVQGYLPGVTPEQTFNHFYDPLVRMKWDEFMGLCRTVELFPSHNADITISVFATPPGVTNREFVEYRQIDRDADGGICILGRSCTHPDAPLCDTRVRGSIVTSAYYFKPLEHDEGHDTMVTGFLKQDLGGYIPSYFISTLNRRVIAEWMDLFITSCIRTYAGERYKHLLSTMESIDTPASSL